VPDRLRLIFFDQVSKGFPIASPAILYRRQIIHSRLSLTYISAAEKIFKDKSKNRRARHIILGAAFGRGFHVNLNLRPSSAPLTPTGRHTTLSGRPRACHIS
jgi:hypothetical protein